MPNLSTALLQMETYVSDSTNRKQWLYGNKRCKEIALKNFWFGRRVFMISCKKYVFENVFEWGSH